MLNMWVDVFGPKGVTYGAPPDDAGQRTLSGRMYAEHVITRLFAEPSERKVTQAGAARRGAGAPDALRVDAARRAAHAAARARSRSTRSWWWTRRRCRSASRTPTPTST